MFKPNDYVMSFSSGVCQVVDVIPETSTDTAYYVLQPVYHPNMTIKLPVSKAATALRPILTKDEVVALIATMPQHEPLVISDGRERSTRFKAALRTRDCEELSRMIKTLYLEKEAKTAAHKKMAKMDEEIMKTAERQLHEEFAVALQITPEEVLPYILEQLAKLEQTNANE